MADEETTTQTPEPSLYDKTETLVSRQEAANKESRLILEEEKKLHAQKMLGGQSEAGQTPEKPKEETAKEYSDRIDKEISEGKHDD